MNSRQFTLILLIAVVLGAVGWTLLKRNEKSWVRSANGQGERVAKFDLNDVAQITIKESDVQLDLTKKNDHWGVSQRDDYPANFFQVSYFLKNLWELKVTQQVQVGQSPLSRLGLTPPGPNSAGTLVTLKDKDGKQLATLLVGKQLMRRSDQTNNDGSGVPAGRYVMPEDGSQHAYLVSTPLNEITSAPERWLQRDFIVIEKPQSIALASDDPARPWKLIRETETSPWKFADAKPGEEVDPAKVSGVVNALASTSFSDLADPKAKPDVTGFDKPTMLTVDTFDGFHYSLKIGKLGGDSFPVAISVGANLSDARIATPNEKPEDKGKADADFATKKKKLQDKLDKEKKLEGRSFLIPSQVISRFLRNRSELSKMPAPAAAAPSPAAKKSTPRR